MPTPRDRQTVEILAGCGVIAAEISCVLGISERTLYNKFPVELNNGRAKVHAKVVGNVLKIAMGDDAVALKACMFLLQTRFGWSYPAMPVPIGKKDSAVIEAQTAHEDSDWGRLVN